MIRPEPDSLDALLRALLVERFLTTDRDRSTATAATDTPEAIAHRRGVLDEALGDEPDNVVPLRSGKRAA